MDGRYERRAEKAFDSFLDRFGDKYPKAAKCLQKDRKELLAFYDFPATHWVHIRITNPIESTFSTVSLVPTRPEAADLGKQRLQWSISS